MLNLLNEERIILNTYERQCVVSILFCVVKFTTDVVTDDQGFHGW